jgi:hypothetical protein
MWKKKQMTDVQLNKELTEGLHDCMHKCALVNSPYSIDKLNKRLPIYSELGQDLVSKGNEEKHSEDKTREEKHSDKEEVHDNKHKQQKQLKHSLSISTSALAPATGNTNEKSDTNTQS